MVDGRDRTPWVQQPTDSAGKGVHRWGGRLWQPIGRRVSVSLVRAERRVFHADSANGSVRSSSDSALGIVWSSKP